MNEIQTSVLIAGAGPVGLALALELGLRGIDCLVAEKRDGALRVPKMSAVSTRNMEFCRRWGIAEAARHAVWRKGQQLDFVYVENLSGRELGRYRNPVYGERDPKAVSPESSCHCPQIFFDPILAERVRKQPGVRFAYDTELLDFKQENSGIRAEVAGLDGVRSRIAARYLVGCDGASGLVRQALDLKLEGLGALANSINIYFRSPELANLHDKGWARIYRLIDEAGCWSELIPIDGVELWRLSVFDDQSSLSRPEAALARVFGKKFPFEVINVSAWERRDFVAADYRRGDVFIAGDAAHQCSPTGGLGMATGIEDAVNLGWKLAAMLQGWGGPCLLDSYAAERRPIAKRNVDLSTRSYLAVETIPAWKHGSDIAAYKGVLDSWRDNLGRYTVPDHVKMQYTYEDSPICWLDGTPHDDPEPPVFAHSARPGSRAPHSWLDDGRSTHDLFGEDFTLLRLGEAPPDGAPLLAEARRVGMPIHEVVVHEAQAVERYAKPLALVRPDGHVAWRGEACPADVVAVIERVRGASEVNNL